MEPDVKHDEERQVFVVEDPRGEAMLSYSVVDDTTVNFQSTFVPGSLRGLHIGTALVRTGLEWAKATGRRVIPSCWFVGNVVARHPEYRELLATRP